VKPSVPGFSGEQVLVPDSSSFLLVDWGPPGLGPLLPSCLVISGKR
jgi:hypothetical protein